MIFQIFKIIILLILKDIVKCFNSQIYIAPMVIGFGLFLQ